MFRKSGVRPFLQIRSDLTSGLGRDGFVASAKNANDESPAERKLRNSDGEEKLNSFRSLRVRDGHAGR